VTVKSTNRGICPPTFRRNLLPKYSGAKSKPSNKPAGGKVNLDLLFDHEDEGSTFLRNVDEFPPDYTALRPRRQYSMDTKTFHDRVCIPWRETKMKRAYKLGTCDWTSRYPVVQHPVIRTASGWQSCPLYGTWFNSLPGWRGCQPASKCLCNW
jgi:hypothetical protein